jgi:Cys-rich protein (TIGR01571 family)
MAGAWSTGFYDCCGKVDTPSGEVGGSGLCCYAFCCSCLLFGDNSEYMSDAEGVFCAGQGKGTMACIAYFGADLVGHFLLIPLGFLLHIPLRGAIRKRYGLPEKPCMDCCAVCCCYACALTQETKELKHRGAQPIPPGQPFQVVQPVQQIQMK